MSGDLPPGCTQAMVDEAMGGNDPCCEGCGQYTDRADLHADGPALYCEACHPDRCHAPDCDGWGEFACDPCGKTFCDEHTLCRGVMVYGIETTACGACSGEEW